MYIYIYIFEQFPLGCPSNPWPIWTRKKYVKHDRTPFKQARKVIILGSYPWLGGPLRAPSKEAVDDVGPYKGTPISVYGLGAYFGSSRRSQRSVASG